MSEMTDSAAERGDKYFLQEQERWENLGLDWEGWNTTVAKILQQKSTANPLEQE